METTPLIICGMGRSGTRNAASVLNTHPSVALRGELPTGVAKSLFELLTTLDKTYSRNPNHSRVWAAKKAAFIYESFDYLGKAPKAEPLHEGQFAYVGHKTPHHELLFEEYENHFGTVGLTPRYLYCARDAKSCWRSYKSMPWSAKRTVESFLAEYVASFRHLDAMQQRVGDRVTLASLNEFKAASDKVDWYRKTLFEPLGLELDDALAKRIRVLPNVNATVRVTGQDAQELTSTELKLIDEDDAVQAIQATYFA